VTSSNAAAVANQLLHPARLPAGTADPLPGLGWLLGELNGGIALTQTGNLNRMFVQQNAERFGWDFDRPPRTEDDLSTCTSCASWPSSSGWRAGQAAA
jgi:hypothetical protein